MDIKDALYLAKTTLLKSASADVLRETRIVLSDILKKDLSFILLNYDYELTQSEEKIFFEFLNRRKTGEPLQYILNEAYFYGREFYVDSRVLVPRKETELSLEYVIDKVKKENLTDVLELGAGSGAFSISLGLETDANIRACDISKAALEVCKINQKNFSSKCKFFESDLFSSIKGKFDLIYSNPPYIKSKDIENLQVEVKDFEPRLALDGGSDGLHFYRKIIANAKKYLKDVGYLVFEIGFDQARDVEVLLLKEDFKNIEILQDYSGKDRIISGKRI